MPTRTLSMRSSQRFEEPEVTVVKRMHPSFLLAVLLVAYPAVSLGATDTFYLKADVGYSIPFITNLSDELERQGRDGLEPGYGLSVSLGKTFLGMQWAVEGNLSIAFYPEFNYLNDHEDFTGDISHYGYSAILFKRILPERTSFSPSLGVGVGYGLTNLIEGGGRIKAFEGLGIFRIESSFGTKTNAYLEVAYTLGLEKKRFEKPFLENIPGDIVKDSGGNPLEDRYSSLDIRLGVLIWLKPPRE